MIQLIAAIFMIGLCVAIAQGLWKLAAKGARGALPLVTAVPELLGTFVEETLGELRLQNNAAIALACVASGFCVVALVGWVPHLGGNDLEAYKFCLLAILFVAMLVQRGKRLKDQVLSEPIPLFEEKDQQFFRFYFGCIFMMIAAFFTETTYFWDDWRLSWIFLPFVL